MVDGCGVCVMTFGGCDDGCEVVVDGGTWDDGYGGACRMNRVGIEVEWFGRVCWQRREVDEEEVRKRDGMLGMKADGDDIVKGLVRW